MYKLHSIILLCLISLVVMPACQGDSPSEPEEEELVLLEGDMSSPRDMDMSRSGCAGEQVELLEDLTIEGELIPRGCYTPCDSSADCQPSNPRCHDALDEPICLPARPAPECGDGEVEGDETCDGDCVMEPGDCPTPRGACVQATIEGSARTCDATCSEAPIVACEGGDGCCPSGCTAAMDSDCEAEMPATGMACTNPRDCTGDAAYSGATCFLHWRWGEGYCSRPCEQDADCSGDGGCLSSGQGKFCYDRCVLATDCREGYTCSDFGQSKYCLPLEGSGVSKAGGACESNANCGEGEFCQLHETGFPDGFCSIQCATSNDCTAGTRCIAEDVGPDQTPIGFCSPSCTQDSECRPGYYCQQSNTCWPRANGEGAVGSACTSRTDCMGNILGVCIESTQNFPDGYCSILCQSDSECGQSAHCATVLGSRICTPSCANNADCARDGYVCADADNDSSGECLPGGDGIGGVGDRCDDLADCSGGAAAICVNALGDTPEWTAGYCTQRCTTSATCPEGSHCGNDDASQPAVVCLRDCEDASDCRTGYACLDNDQDGVRECIPRPSLSF